MKKFTSPFPTALIIAASLSGTGCMQDLVLGESREEVVKIDPGGDIGSSRQDSGGDERDMARPDEGEDLSPPSYLFEPVQMAYSHGCGTSSSCFIQMMLIDVEGRLACLASEDYDILPSSAGRYMVSAHELDRDAFEQGCPVGEYLIEAPSTPYCAYSGDSMLQHALEYGQIDNCLEHYAWGDRGERIRKDEARSGLISVSRDEASCQFTFELVFEDLPDYQGSFSIPLAELPAAGMTFCAM